MCFRLLSVAASLAAGLIAGATVAQARVNVTIDLSTQRMHVTSSSGNYTWKVSTGRGKYVTPRGSYRPYLLKRMHRSRKYNNAPMPYSIFYRGGYAIHGTNSVRALGAPASHGCVRLAPGNAAKLFAMVKREGARIHVTGSRDVFYANNKRYSKKYAAKKNYRKKYVKLKRHSTKKYLAKVTGKRNYVASRHYNKRKYAASRHYNKRKYAASRHYNKRKYAASKHYNKRKYAASKHYNKRKYVAGKHYNKRRYVAGKSYKQQRGFAAAPHRSAPLAYAPQRRGNQTLFEFIQRPGRR